MRKILFFDTETTGVPKDYKASYTDVDNWPRVISLAWMLVDEDGNIIRQSYELVKPDGWVMPTEKFWLDNGYTQETNMEKGLPIEQLLDAFYEAKMEADFLAAHNLNFDHRIVWAEFIRAGREPRSGMTKICTMMKSTNVCKIPAANGRGFKWPKLEELHRHLFGCDFGNAHDASSDVVACMECFFELTRMGVINLDSYAKTEAL